MEQEKVKFLIDMINNMDLKNKLRLGVCMSSSAYTNLKYNKVHIHSIFDKRLKEDLSAKEKIITKLREEKESLKAQLQKFKGFWHNLMSHFHKKITYDNDQNYKIVSDDLYKNGIFDDNDNEIANNIYRKVTIPTENKKKKKKKKNDFNLN